MKGFILIVDSRDVFRSSIKNILVKKGYKTIGVSSGKIAYKRAKHNDIDLVVLKHDLPDWSGLKTLRKIKKEFNDINVICIADGLSEEVRQKYKKQGVEAIIPKSVFWGQTEKFINDFLPDKLEKSSV